MLSRSREVRNTSCSRPSVRNSTSRPARGLISRNPPPSAAQRSSPPSASHQSSVKYTSTTADARRGPEADRCAGHNRCPPDSTRSAARSRGARDTDPIEAAAGGLQGRISSDCSAANNGSSNQQIESPRMSARRCSDLPAPIRACANSPRPRRAAAQSMSAFTCVRLRIRRERRSRPRAGHRSDRRRGRPRQRPRVRVAARLRAAAFPRAEVARDVFPRAPALRREPAADFLAARRFARCPVSSAPPTCSPGKRAPQRQAKISSTFGASSAIAPDLIVVGQLLARLDRADRLDEDPPLLDHCSRNSGRRMVDEARFVAVDPGIDDGPRIDREQERVVVLCPLSS